MMRVLGSTAHINSLTWVGVEREREVEQELNKYLMLLIMMTAEAAAVAQKLLAEAEMEQSQQSQHKKRKTKRRRTVFEFSTANWLHSSDTTLGTVNWTGRWTDRHCRCPCSLCRVFPPSFDRDRDRRTISAGTHIHTRVKLVCVCVLGNLWMKVKVERKRKRKRENQSSSPIGYKMAVREREQRTSDPKCTAQGHSAEVLLIPRTSKQLAKK